MLDNIYWIMLDEFRYLAEKITDNIIRLRRLSGTLGYAAEIEALARISGKDIQSKNPNILQDRKQVHAVISMQLDRFKNRMTEEIERAYVSRETVIELNQRLNSVLPQVRKFKKVFTRVKEADPIVKEKKISASTDFINDAEWEDILDEYKSAYIPPFRFVGRDGRFPRTTDETYAWEVERYVTDDFLQQIKEGTLQAADEAGVTDLIWIAVMDDKTRPEHAAKDGLTSTEIEAKLKDEWGDFEDQSTVAPGGFNCRCRSVPFFEKIDETKAEQFDYSSFEEWLNG